MLIQRDQLIVGLPAVEVRAMMKALYAAPSSARALGEAFALDGESTDRLIADLRSERLIEETEKPVSAFRVAESERELTSRPTLWVPTIAGNALAKARIGAPMPRDTAQVLLDDVIRRSRAVNESPAWLHWVTRIVLYGSYAQVGDGPVGDIDLAAELRPRYSRDEYLRRQTAMIERNDAQPKSLIDSLAYAQTSLLRHLRGRSPRVDLVDFHGERSLPPGATLRAVYDFDPPAEPLS